MRAQIVWTAWLGVGISMGCEVLPPLDYESEHALVGTSQVEEVCAGTLDRIDWTIEYVDQALGRATDDEPARIYVVSGEDVVAHCGDNYGGCVSGSTVFIASRRFEEALTHEVVHERVRRAVGRWSKAIFDEGIACAIGSAYRTPSEWAPRSPPDAYLAVNSGSELMKLHHGYYHAGELTHWLLDSYGAARVLGFMREADPRASAEEVRATYTAHFGRDIDEDLFAHARDDAELTRANTICTGVELARDPDRMRFRLEADLACDSPRVENDWSFRDRVFVEWILRIDENTRGPWSPVRVPGDAAIPAGTLLELVPCRRSPRARYRWTPSTNTPRILEPGLYRIRWHGPMNGDAKLDLELGGPCDNIAQDCEPGERCSSAGVCIPI